MYSVVMMKAELSKFELLLVVLVVLLVFVGIQRLI